MNSLLEDLLAQESWADAEHWRALELHAPAREDLAIQGRLHHMSDNVTFSWFKDPPLVVFVDCHGKSEKRGKGRMRIRFGGTCLLQAA